MPEIAFFFAVCFIPDCLSPREKNGAGLSNIMVRQPQVGFT